MTPDRTILYEEVERVNAERGTNVTVERMLQGFSKNIVKSAARDILRTLLIGLLLFIAGFGLWMGIDIDASTGTHAVIISIGVIALGLSFFPLRAEWRTLRDWNREQKAMNEIIRRVDARHTAREQGWTE